jgi:hypothetical protein
MKNSIIFTLTILTFFSQDIFAQTSESPNMALKSKYALNIGVSYKGGYKNFGGNLKLDYLLNYKTGFGIKTIATNNRFTFQMDETYRMKSKNGLYLISDLTLTHYIIGDYFKSEGGIYFDFGIGYQSEELNIMHQQTGYPTYTNHYRAGGLGGHASIGGSYKIGKGRIYSEILLGGILLGKYQDIAKYPENYPLQKSWRNESGNGTGIHLNNDGILAISLGYNHCFR